MGFLVLGIFFMVGLLVIGGLCLLAALLWWLFLLPFHILGWALKLVGALLALPLLLVLGVLAATGFGLLFLFPLLPLAILVAAGIWLFRRQSRPPLPH